MVEDGADSLRWFIGTLLTVFSAVFGGAVMWLRKSIAAVHIRLDQQTQADDARHVREIAEQRQGLERVSAKAQEIERDHTDFKMYVLQNFPTKQELREAEERICARVDRVYDMLREQKA